MRTTVDIDEEALVAAAAVLGTATKVDTVNRALAEIAARPSRVAAWSGYSRRQMILATPRPRRDLALSTLVINLS